MQQRVPAPPQLSSLLASHPAAAPTRWQLARQDFELGPRPVKFISEGAGNGKRGRKEPAASPCPAQAGMDCIFEIKTHLAHTQTCRESLPLDDGGAGWGCKVGVGGRWQELVGGLPCGHWAPRGD